MSYGPDAYTDQWRVSRKTHKCCECGGTIFYKERYHYFSGVWDGSASTYKTCKDCSDLRTEIEDNFDSRDDRLNFESLVCAVWDSGWKPYVEQWIDNLDRRGVPVSPKVRESFRQMRNPKL